MGLKGNMLQQVIPTTPPCKCKYMAAPAAPEARLPVCVHRQVYFRENTDG